MRSSLKLGDTEKGKILASIAEEVKRLVRERSALSKDRDDSHLDRTAVQQEREEVEKQRRINREKQMQLEMLERKLKRMQDL